MFFLAAVVTAMCGVSVSYGVWQASSYLYNACRGYGPRYQYKLAQSVDYLEQTLTENGIAFEIIDHDSDPSVLIAHVNKLATKLKVLDFCKTIIMVIDITLWNIGKQLSSKELDFLNNATRSHYNDIVEIYELLSQTTYLGMYDILIRVVSKVHTSLRNNRPLYRPKYNDNSHYILKAEAMLIGVVKDLLEKIKQ